MLFPTMDDNIIRRIIFNCKKTIKKKNLIINEDENSMERT